MQSNQVRLQPRTAEHVLQGDYVSHTDSKLGLLVLASAHHSHSRYTARCSFPRIFLLSLDLDLSVFPCISPRILLNGNVIAPWSPYPLRQSEPSISECVNILFASRTARHQDLICTQDIFKSKDQPPLNVKEHDRWCVYQDNSALQPEERYLFAT